MRLKLSPRIWLATLMTQGLGTNTLFNKATPIAIIELMELKAFLLEELPIEIISSIMYGLSINIIAWSSPHLYKQQSKATSKAQPPTPKTINTSEH